MTENKGHLRWLCRRGMLELDVLLERFLDNGYDHLNIAEKELFELLLKEQDPILYGWFLGHESPKLKFCDLILKIKAA